MEPDKNQQPTSPAGYEPTKNPTNQASPNPVPAAQQQAGLHNHWNTRRDYANSWVQPRAKSQQYSPPASTAPNQQTANRSNEDEDEDFDMPELDDSPLTTMPTQPVIEPKFSLKKINRYLPLRKKEQPDQTALVKDFSGPKTIVSTSSDQDNLALISLALAFGAPLGGLIIAFTALKNAKLKNEPNKLIILSLVINSVVLILFIFFIYLVLTRKI